MAGAPFATMGSRLDSHSGGARWWENRLSP
jgi:hypothetical protein